MFRRAALTPWLPVVIMIDEVEALVPDRTQLKGGDGAANVVNVVITAFGGGQVSIPFAPLLPELVYVFIWLLVVCMM
jgi:hypothetical protein